MGKNRPVKTSRLPIINSKNKANPWVQCPKCLSKQIWAEPMLTDQKRYSYAEGFDLVCICGHRTLVFKIKNGKYALNPET